jgi:hypothetical protein
LQDWLWETHQERQAEHDKLRKEQEEKRMQINKAWHVKQDGTKFSAVGSTTPSLTPGEYIFEEDSDGALWAVKQKTVTDNLIDLPGLPTDFIANQIDLFWSKKQEYAEYGWLQKRGIMLHGIPGCGKSSIIALLKRRLISTGGVVFSMGEEGYPQLIDGIKQVRAVEPERPIMTIVEDIETYLEGSNGSNVARSETAALSLYDGADQFNHIVHIGTTNKPDVVADRFMRRPGRFDLVVGLHAPGRETREAYLRAIGQGKITEQDILKILDGTKGLSLAYMREIASTYLVLGIPLEETVGRLNKNYKGKFEQREGFSVGFDFKPSKQD